MAEITDDPSSHQPGKIDECEIERPQTFFEQPAPKHEAQHIPEDMQRIGMQETGGDEPPILAALDRAGVHGAVTKQELRRNAHVLRLSDTQQENRGIYAKKQL